MSTISDRLPAFTLLPPAIPTAGSYQSSSWAALAAVWRLVALWTERRNQRQGLRHLADQARLLADLGLTRAQALREAAKPFWRP